MKIMQKLWYAFLKHGHVAGVKTLLKKAAYFSLGFFFLTWNSLAYSAQIFSWSPSPESLSVSIGDILEISLPALSSENQKKIGRLEVQEGVFEKNWRIRRLNAEGTQLLLIPLREGVLLFPEWDVFFPSGELMGRTESFQLTVQGPPELETDVFFPPVALDWPFWLRVSIQIGFGLLLLFLCSMILWGAIRLTRNRKKSTDLLPRLGLEKITPERALENLQGLRQGLPVSDDQVRFVFHEIAENTKAYLGGRLQFNALEMTSFEVLEHLRSNHGTPGLERSFQELDLYRFSKKIPSAEEQTQVVSMILSACEKLEDDFRKGEKK
jgi:hypothetical protein